MEHRSFAPDIVVLNDDYACGNKRAGELAPDVAPEELRKEKQVGGPVNCSDSELCTFLRALEEGFLPTYYSDTNQFVQLKSMSIASRSYQRGKKTVVFHGFQSLQMSSILTDDHGADLLTSYLAAFRARTSATQDIKSELKVLEADCGKKWPASFAKLDRDSFLWKTSQRCLIEGWASFSQTWPRWGLMRDGECWEVPTPKATKLAKGYGLWPTLKASDGEQRTSNLDYFKRRLSIAPDLPVIVALSTPPTPGGFYGRLNPDWCEWLTGFPVKWTEFTPLAMRKTQEWQQQHSPSWPNNR